jgi:predicted HD superfamily hydrolase involved in NAD metabolism
LPEKDWLAFLHQTLTPGRVQHSLGVAETAASLAELYEEDPERARLAGITHDLAREMRPADMLAEALMRKLPMERVERQAPILLHGPIEASRLAEEGLHDPEILQAVRLHTTGAPGMGKLAQIVFVADAIEPGREYPGVEELRDVSRSGLRTAVAACLRAQLQHLVTSDQLIHPRSVATYNSFI